jgi:hypothetical protein
VYWPELQPVLEATCRLLSDHDEVSPEEVIAELGAGTDSNHVKRALAQLYREGYIAGQDIEQVDWPISITATEKGSQEAAGWPKPGAGGGDHLDLLLRLLDEKIGAAETPPEEKTRLQRARDSLADATRDIIVGVLSNFIAKHTGASD